MYPTSRSTHLRVHLQMSSRSCRSTTETVYEDQYRSCTMPTDSGKVHCTVLKQYKGPYPSSTVPSTASHLYKGQHHSSTMPTDLGKPSITVQLTVQLMTSFTTTTPSTATTGRMTTKQVNPVQVHPESACKALLEHCMHVHQPAVQVCKPGE